VGAMVLMIILFIIIIIIIIIIVSLLSSLLRSSSSPMLCDPGDGPCLAMPLWRSVARYQTHAWRHVAENYEASVLEYVSSVGFKGYLRGPVETRQDGCTYGSLEGPHLIHL
jgi:ABC-type transport system involved in multi-copper enzyme maturation permease subunit